ncbi:MAG: hypothetical protein H6878_10675 [Rhodobiaceae bacterium]|nr:hypothetical protein [Rhodobiaceae bacterium]MCC0042147.1 hypothetical protein [Rhodobiaceae bacterium]
MEDIYFWRLSEELTIVQAALLVAGEDPSTAAEYVEGWEVEKRPPRYEAAKYAIKNALRGGRVKGRLVQEIEYDQNGNFSDYVEGSVDIRASVMEIDSLRDWLRDRGFTGGFFFPDSEATPGYLDPSNERYAPKLAAAVRAWIATDDPKALAGRHPKQALMKWLRENAATFGLTDDDGNPSESTLDEQTGN